MIVPTFQRREHVRRAVASVLAQTFRDFELIVIDDGSTDGTGEALAPLADRLRYHWQPNRGLAAARNEGLRMAGGEIVAFLDSDDTWQAHHLALVTRALADNPEAVLAFSERWSSSAPGAPGAVHLTQPFPRLLVGNYVGAPSGIAVRRDAVVGVGGFDERLRFIEDNDLWLRLAALGGLFAAIPKGSVVKRATAGSLMEARKRGQYLAALEHSMTRLLPELERGQPDAVGAWARGRQHLLRALRALDEDRAEQVKVELAVACRLLPELARRPDSVVRHVRFNLPPRGARSELARQVATIAHAWPDQHSAAAHWLWRQAIVTAMASGKVIEASRLAAGAPMRRLPVLAHRVLLRTGIGPLRPLWWWAHEALARSAAAYLRGRGGETSAYLKGGLGVGDPVFGLSDIDLAFVVAGEDGEDAARRQVQQRWRRLRRTFPVLCDLMFEPPQIYGQRELQAVAAATTLTHGLERPAVSASSRDRRRASAGAERVGLYGLTGDWRLIGGRDRRPPPRTQNRDDRRIAAWAELQFWWLQAFKACANPRAPWASYTCVKLITEPARVWLWLARGEQITTRRAVIERAMTEMPEHEDALRRAAELFDALPKSPEAPLAETLQWLVRMSRQVALEIGSDVRSAGVTEVRLLGGDRSELVVAPDSTRTMGQALGTERPLNLLPLVDWRARVWSLPPDECFEAAPERDLEPSFVGTAAAACNAGVYVALLADGLLVIPSLKRARLRALQCPLTDPVSFALLEGSDCALFPNVAGWSARDSARRAVAEHLGWLVTDAHGSESSVEILGRLLTAARAALFLESVDAGSPELRLTVSSVAEALDAREAYEAYRAGRVDGQAPSPELIADFRRAVLKLPHVGDASRSTASSSP